MAYLGTLVLVYIKDLIYFKECSFQESYRISNTHIKTVGSKNECKRQNMFE